MCEQIVRTVATSFLVPNHFSTLIFCLLNLEISTRECLNDRTSVPRGPLTVTLLALTLNSTLREKKS
jgi:hypothetical protein